MKNKSFVFVLIWICVAFLSLVSCGGGGGDGEVIIPDTNTPTVQSQDDNSPSMVINHTNVQKTIALLSFGYKIVELIDPLIFIPYPLRQEWNDENNAQPLLVRKAIHLFADQLSIQSKDITRSAGPFPLTWECANDGGNASGRIWVDGTFDDFCNLVDVRGTFTMVNCADEDGGIVDGSFDLSSTGSICNPDTFSITLTNATISDNGDGIQTSNLKIDGNDLSWTGSPAEGTLFMTDGRLTMTGQAVASSGDTIVSMAFDAFTQEMENSRYLKVSGDIYGDCLNGWATLSTPSRLYIPDADACPVEGLITVSGADNMSMDVIFNADGSIAINEGENETIIDSCEELDPSCPVQLR